MKKMTFNTSNEFNEAFQAFQSTTLSKELSEKFRVKPFFEQYATIKRIVSSTSYFINVFAVATSFVGVFAFLKALLQNDMLAALFASIFLTLIEMLKRLTIPKAIKEWLQFHRLSVPLLCSSSVLILLSVTLSYSGAHEAVQLFTPQATVTDVATPKKEYTDRIKQLEKQKKEIKRTMSWQSKLTPQGAKAYNEVTAQIGHIENDMLQNINRITTNNDKTLQNHSETTTVKSGYFALFTLLFDLSLIFAFFFIEYYDYRSFTEFSDVVYNETIDNNNVENVATNEPASGNVITQSVATANNGFSLNTNAIQLAIKKAKANVSAYKAKLKKGEGRPETNNVGVERWNNSLQELEQMKFQISE